MQIALTHIVPTTISRCELTYLAREPIDYELAVYQHNTYLEALREAGLKTVELRDNPECPDACFVEDTAVVVDEVAVITRMGVQSRRAEVKAVERFLSEYRPIERIEEPGTLEGGDIIVAGKKIFAGMSPRTNTAGVKSLSQALTPYGYEVIPVGMRDCLHLKSACTMIWEDTLLANPQWADLSPFSKFRVIEVADDEPWGANALRVGPTVFVGSEFPQTAEIIQRAGYQVKPIDISEFLKAEAGLTCSSIIFNGHEL